MFQIQSERKCELSRVPLRFLGLNNSKCGSALRGEGHGGRPEGLPLVVLSLQCYSNIFKDTLGRRLDVGTGVQGRGLG